MSARSVPACGNCRHFDADPAGLEAALPGLAALSSAFASVRADDGLCGRHARYVAASSICAGHRTREGAAAPSA